MFGVSSMTVDYQELDGSRVAAILEKDCVPALQWDGDPIDVGRIVGLVPHDWSLRPVWLAEVLGCGDGALLVTVRCLLGGAAAAEWYGPPWWEDPWKDWGFGVSDTRPANYDVYGVLPSACASPPVTVDLKYVVVPRLRMFVPPPYRRHCCWYTEKAIADSQRSAR